MRHSAACGCGRDDRNGSSVDGFQVPGRVGGGRGPGHSQVAA